jgi:hypothetical protein
LARRLPTPRRALPEYSVADTTVQAVVGDLLARIPENERPRARTFGFQLELVEYEPGAQERIADIQRRKAAGEAVEGLRVRGTPTIERE